MNLEEFKKLQEEIALTKGLSAYLRAVNPCKYESRLAKNKFLYFIQCGDAIKIGISSDPEIRLETLATGAPGKLTLIAMIKNCGDKENYCHKYLSHLRIHGEWFRYTEEINKLIKELNESN